MPPVVLAWAVTIHKVQGLSLDRAVMDLGGSIFAHCQAYVAFKTVSSLRGAILMGLSGNPLSTKHIIGEAQLMCTLSMTGCVLAMVIAL